MPAYKTLTLQLLRQFPIHSQLREKGQLEPAVDQYAQELKDSHETWKQQLAEGKPGSDESQIRAEALELALNDLQERFANQSFPQRHASLSLDSAMAFLRKATPPK